MKKLLSNIYLLAALFMIGAAITSCSKSDDTPAPEPKPVGPTTYTMTIKATKSADAKTRALSPDGSKINATWTEGDVVVVYEGGTELGTLTAQDLTDGNTQCTLKGTLTQAPAGSSVTLKYQGNADYSSQGGTIAYISDHCDYAKADVTVTVDKDKKRITGSGADFVNQQAIVKFTLKEGEALLSPGALKVQFSRTTEPANTVTVTLSDISSIYSTNGNGVVYVATPGNTYDVVTLNATMDNTFYTDTYSYTKTGATFANNYYAITVKMVKNFNPYKTPLTLECCAGTNKGASIWVDNYGDLEYTVNNGTTWIPWSNISNTLDITNEQTVSFRRTTWTSGLKIHCNGDCYIYGNIMSLLEPTNFAARTDLTYENTFVSLFQDNEFIKHDDVGGKDLVLPATTLIYQCYTNMFNGCTQLNHIKCLATEGFDAFQCTDNWLMGVPDNGTFVVNSSLIIDNPNDLTTSTVSIKKGESTVTVWKRNNDYGVGNGIPKGWTVSK